MREKKVKSYICVIFVRLFGSTLSLNSNSAYLLLM